MKAKFVKCEFCSTEIRDACQLATVRTTIEGKEHVFCCAKCAEGFHGKKRRS